MPAFSLARIFAALSLAAATLGVAGPCPAQTPLTLAPGIQTWGVYYGSEDKTEVLGRFDLIVIDPSTPAPARRENGLPLMLGYLTLGEIDEDGPYSGLLDAPFALGRNDFWKSRRVDVRHPDWRAHILDTAIPSLLAQGFDGIFLDTMDTALALEASDPKKFKGMADALISLVAEIRKRHPEILICQNRGFEISQRTAPFINYLMVEGLTSTMNHDTHVYGRVSDSERRDLTRVAREAGRANTTLVVLALDYAGPKDGHLVKEAVTYARRQGFVPYVANYMLDEVFSHTLSR